MTNKHGIVEYSCWYDKKILLLKEKSEFLDSLEKYRKKIDNNAIYKVNVKANNHGYFYAVFYEFIENKKNEFTGKELEKYIKE